MVKFQGEYISVFNEKTEEENAREEKVEALKDFKVPKGYTVYVRGCKTVYFYLEPTT